MTSSLPLPDVSVRRNWWPLGISAALALFASGLVALIVISASGPVDLVTGDYYDREIRYQEEIDQLNRARSLETPLQIEWDEIRRQIAVIMPMDHVRGALQGKVQLYRPAAAGMDRELPLALDSNGVQRIDGAILLPGLWKVRVEWEFAGQTYLVERKLRLPGGA